MTPFEKFFDKTPDLSHFRVFGCQAFMYLEKPKRKKLESRALEGFLLGYSNNSKSYLIGFFEGAELITKSSRNVKFNETSFPGKTLFANNESGSEFFFELNERGSEVELQNTELVADTHNLIKDVSELPNGDLGGNPETLVNEISDESITQNQPHSSSVHTTTRYGRKVKPPNRYAPGTSSNLSYNLGSSEFDEIETFAYHSDYVDQELPKSIEEALSSPEWYRAMKAEYDSLQKNEVWDIVEMPEGKNLVTGKWHFALKRNSKGEIIRHKARYVARGFKQKRGVDYDQTYSPTVKMVTLRVLLSSAVQNEMKLKQLDIKTAYLNAGIEEEIFVDQPPGFVQKNANGKSYVCRLKKSLYGLKQSGRNWFNTLRDFLLSIQFKPSKSDPCLFLRERNGHKDFVASWVDDLVYCSDDINFYEKFEKALSTKFLISEVDDLNWFLGMQIRHEKGRLEISQENYIEKLLENFGMKDAKGLFTPVAEKQQISRSDCPDEGSQEQKEMKNCNFRGMIGCLNYLANTTRPDITFAVRALSRYVQNPGRKHWLQGKHILRYLKATKCRKLTYRKSKTLVLTGFSDADWAGKLDDRRSTSGFCFFSNSESGAISWSSKLQTTVATSTAEAETMSLFAASQELEFLRGLANEIGIDTEKPTKVHVDNQACIAITKNTVNSQKVKHFAIKLSFIQEKIEMQHLDVEFGPTSEMIADLLTKPLAKVKVEMFSKRLSGECNL